jgi:hypothetical protein
VTCTGLLKASCSSELSDLLSLRCPRTEDNTLAKHVEICMGAFCTECLASKVLLFLYSYWNLKCLCLKQQKHELRDRRSVPLPFGNVKRWHCKGWRCSVWSHLSSVAKRYERLTLTSHNSIVQYIGYFLLSSLFHLIIPCGEY